MLNIAMLSKWHVHAGDYANQVRKNGHNISVVWDEDEQRGKDWAAELGCEYEKDLAKVLARSDVDAVIVDTETSKHRDVMVAAANAKKHIFTEKTLAATKKEALEIEEAVMKNNVIFTISDGCPPTVVSPMRIRIQLRFPVSSPLPKTYVISKRTTPNKYKYRQYFVIWS